MNKFYTILLIILLSACSDADIFGKQEQSIVYNTSSGRVPVNDTITVTAAATGLITDQDNGVITYSSSNNSVATVNSTTGGVTGVVTGLSWQQSLNQVNIINNGSDYAGFNDWRLPNIEELRSLVNRNRQSPNINSTTFSNVDNVNYWSNTPHKNSNSAYSIHFNYGDDAINLRNDNAKARLVRNIN